VGNKYWSVLRLFETNLYYRYEPLFNYFMEMSDSAFRIAADNYVTDDSGTGVVHNAPAFGEDDYRVCVENGIIRKVRAHLLHTINSTIGLHMKIIFICLVM